MKIEVRCRSCAKRFLLDRAFAGSRLPCPVCGAADGLAAPVAAGSPARSRGREPAEVTTVKLRARRPGGATRSAVAPPATAPAEAGVASEAEEVVCPRCKLHFVPRRAAGTGPDADRRTVLVVEAMDFFRETARDALSGRFEVKTATGLAEARAHLASGRIDLLVLDPELDGGERGFDLLRELPAKPCPVLVFTEQDESEMYGEAWERLQRLGADDMVAKGMNVGEALLRKVAVLLGEQPDEDD